jgi:membrane associated rhomboid family serine protease
LNPVPGRFHTARSATVIISVATAAAWLIAYLGGWNETAALALGFIPARLTGLVTVYSAVPAWLTPLTATLVHAGLLHLGLNLLIFVWCGMLVERVLGAGPLILIYIVAAYTAAIAEWVLFPHSTDPMVGASGAISGIIGAFALSFGRPKRIVRNKTLNQIVNGLWLLAAWVILQWMTGMLGGLNGYQIATPAHVGGFLAGLALQRPLLLWRYRKA